MENTLLCTLWKTKGMGTHFVKQTLKNVSFVVSPIISPNNTEPPSKETVVVTLSYYEIYTKLISILKQNLIPHFQIPRLPFFRLFKLKFVFILIYLLHFSGFNSCSIFCHNIVYEKILQFPKSVQYNNESGNFIYTIGCNV